MPSIGNKVVLITGASSGIGEGTARVLAEHGARVVLGARRTDRLKSLANEIERAGGFARYRALDVVNLDDVKAFVEFAESEFGGIDVLVNNAGVMPLSPLSALKVDEWNWMIDVNIRGVLHGIAAVLPRMEAQGHGHIINVSSVGGFVAADRRCLFGDQVRSSRHLGGVEKGERQDSLRLHLSRSRRIGTCRDDQRRDGPRADEDLSPDRDQAGRHRPRHSVCDRAAE
jgi:NAD(P)-dependent dehydrogenase (short-subunit alcohol dehydrogenase family)